METQKEPIIKIMVSLPRADTPGGGLLKVLYGEAPPGDSHPYPLIYNFYLNGTPFKYLEQKCTCFLYLKEKPKR